MIPGNQLYAAHMEVDDESTLLRNVTKTQDARKKAQLQSTVTNRQQSLKNYEDSGAC